MYSNSISPRAITSATLESPQAVRNPPIQLAINEMQECTEWLMAAMDSLENRLAPVLGPGRMNEAVDKGCSAPTPTVSGLASVIQSQVVRLRQLRMQVDSIAERLEV